MTEATDGIRPQHGLRLDELLRELPEGSRLVGDGSVRVHGVRHDSRRVRAGDLFVVRKGAHADGARFVADAKARGAVAVLASEDVAESLELPRISVRDPIVGLALAAASVYEHPSFGLEVVGITGTNGKTTTTHLVRAAIDGALGAARCGLVGTLGVRYAGLDEVASHTTPEADDLMRAMLAMRRAGATHVAMEVSSIALSLGRVHAVRFFVAAYTNLTQDHLDFHASMEAYGEAKAQLFLDHAPGTSVICVDGAFGRSLAARVRGPLVRVSAHEGTEADLVPTRVELSTRGIDATLRTPAGPLDVRSPLLGSHNVENLVVALGVVHALGLDLAAAARALEGELGAPGRLERCDAAEDDVGVLVDYAHTPDALARVLDAVRAVTKGRVFCVFGCGGDRDPHKRGPMGAAVAERADVAIITSDNPRTEDPIAIAAPIEAAVRASGVAAVAPSDLGLGRGYVVVLDRARAIELAVLAARPGDVVLLAGKGHEDYQLIGAEKRHFDDREQARRALLLRRNGGL